MKIYFDTDDAPFQERKNANPAVDPSLLLAYTNRVLWTKHKYVCISSTDTTEKAALISTLNAYYRCGGDASHTFFDFNIHTHPTFSKYQNKYHTLTISLSSLDTSVCTASEWIHYLQTQLWQQLQGQLIAFPKTAKVTLPNAMEQIYHRTRKPFVILIEGWDAPIQSYIFDAQGQKCYFFFLQMLLRNQRALALAFLTGQFPISSYPHGAMLHGFDEFTPSNLQHFSDIFGFIK